MESVRRAFLEERVVAYCDESEHAEKLRTFIDAACPLARHAVASGRLFDLGHMTDEVMNSEAIRARELYGRRFIDHPFREPWVIFRTWERGTISYLIIPDSSADREFIGMEFCPCKIDEKKVLVLFRSALIVLGPQCPPDHVAGYDLFGSEESLASVSSVSSMTLAAMLLLATKNVCIEKVQGRKYPGTGSEKPMRDYFRVHTADYVTALMGRSGTRGPGTGTHASPVPHLRRGHVRHLPDGRTAWVRDCLVGADEGHFANRRANYATSLH